MGIHVPNRHGKGAPGAGRFAPGEQPALPEDAKSLTLDSHSDAEYSIDVGVDPVADLYDKMIYDEDGFDGHGYDREGFNANGYDGHGYNRNGFTWYGEHRNGTDFDDVGFGALGLHRNGTRWDAAGYNVRGYNDAGFNRAGISNRI